MKKELTYNDISLFSRKISSVKSRFSEEININRKIKFGETEIEVGILMSAPMFDVTGQDLQLKLLKYGQLPIIHRFMTAKEQIKTLEHIVYGPPNIRDKIASYTIGVNDYKEKLDALSKLLKELKKYRPVDLLICIDTANGSSELLIEPIKAINILKNKFTENNIEIMAGNVVTKEACQFLYDLGVKFVRCGISSGSVCSTSVVTGIYRPPVSMLLEINKWRETNAYNDFYIVADGGIKNTDDIMKAIACGADFIMSGRLFAGYTESNSPLLERLGTGEFEKTNEIVKAGSAKHFKYYRGMASEEMAILNNKINNLNKTILPEGVSSVVEYKGDLTKEKIDLILNSIKSSMSYANAKTLDEYYLNIEMVEITESSNVLRRPEK